MVIGVLLPFLLSSLQQTSEKIKMPHPDMYTYEQEIQKYLQHMSRDHFEYAINISLKNRYVYIETPKVGCSTIKDTLQRMELDYPDLRRSDFEMIHDRRFSPLLQPAQTWGLDRLLNNEAFFVFCFVRNPYTRLLSAYLDKIVKGLPPKSNILVAMGDQPGNLNRTISFEEFVDAVCGQTFDEMQYHWKPQYDQTLQEHIKYDFIGRMETFEEDCSHVLSRIRRDYTKYYRAERRHATNAVNQVEIYYTDRLRQKVFEKYKMDFEHFDYEA
jgi:hypothetical protein